MKTEYPKKAGIKEAGPDVYNLGEKVQTLIGPCLSQSLFLLHVVYNKLKGLRVAAV